MLMFPDLSGPEASAAILLLTNYLDTSALMSPYLFTASLTWSAVFWASYSAWIAMEVWICLRDLAPADGVSHDRGSLRRTVACIVAGIVLAFFAPGWFPAARMSLPPMAVFICAMLLFWCGMVLRLWAVLTLGRFFRVTVHISTTHRLVTTGPYRFLRHPSYAGGLLTIFGLGLAIGNWVALVVAPGLALVGYAQRIRLEERALEERFGQTFAERKKVTWALAPFIW